MATPSRTRRLVCAGLAVSSALVAATAQAKQGNRSFQGAQNFALQGKMVSRAGAQVALDQGFDGLTFAERVACQRAIEEVYWGHRIWPKENPQPKPPLSQVMAEAALRAKVVEYLQKSRALALYGPQGIREEQLQAEMERQARQTQQPEMLRELWEALGNDPYLIAECLVRPVLADRLIRSWYAGTERYPEAEPKDFAAWWISVRNQLVGAVESRRAGYRLSAISDGSSGCVDNAWADTSRVQVPRARDSHTAVWTGAEMIVWGGYSDGPMVNTGGRYDPATDTWTATSLVGAPSARIGHSAVWTGTEMIIWGGYSGFPIYSFLDTGARYDPASDTWTATTQVSAPSRRGVHTAVWTGTEMIVWGGHVGGRILERLDTGGRYDPITDTWEPTDTTSVPRARSRHTAVWTGTEMIVWGGTYADDPIFHTLDTGGRYDPITDTWVLTDTTNAPSARFRHTAIWTGTEMIVWGGESIDRFYTGSRYDPATDTWLAMSADGTPFGIWSHTAVWTDAEMIVWGGGPCSFECPISNIGGRYDPATDTWVATSVADAVHGRIGHTAVWTGTEMIVWGGGYVHEPAYVVLDTGGRYCATPRP